MWCIGSNRAATDWENVWTFKKKGAAIRKRVDGPHSSAIGWFDTSKETGVEIGKDDHGAGMATSAAARMVDIHSRSRHIVHEPFAGTGTTFSACHQIDRKCYGTEINPAYCDVIVRRLVALGAPEPVLAPTGQPWRKVAASRGVSLADLPDPGAKRRKAM